MNPYYRTGKAAATIARPLRALASVTLGLFGIGMPCVLIGPQGSLAEVIGATSLIAAGAMTAGLSVVRVIVLFIEADEVQRGYTTFSYDHVDVEQTDPVSHLVVRAAGEPFLTKEERLNRIRTNSNSIPAIHGPRQPGSTRVHRSRMYWVSHAIGLAAITLSLLIKLGLRL